MEQVAITPEADDIRYFHDKFQKDVLHGSELKAAKQMVALLQAYITHKEIKNGTN